MNLKEGDLVKCVEDYSKENSHPEITFPIQGKNYTIREIECQGADYGLRFEEIINPEIFMKPIEYSQKKEPAFDYKKFRKISHKDL